MYIVIGEGPQKGGGYSGGGKALYETDNSNDPDGAFRGERPKGKRGGVSGVNREDGVSG